MTIEETKTLIKNFFESLYMKLKNEDEVLVKICVIEGNEPMWAEGCVPDEEEWVTWRLLPAQVSDKEIAELEESIGVKLPQVLKIFLTTYFHYFDGGIGRNSVENKFEGILNAWNPMLVKNGYLPFAWDEEGYFIRCIDLKNMPDEEKCPVVQIDHEVMFDLEECEDIPTAHGILFDFDGEMIRRKELEEQMQLIADNFFVYLEKLLLEKGAGM